MVGFLFPPALVGCAPVGPGARAAYVQDVLLADNRIWLTREPDRIADTFASPADDAYDFMRGTLALHFADLARPRIDQETTRFLSPPTPRPCSSSVTLTPRTRPSAIPNRARLASQPLSSWTWPLRGSDHGRSTCAARLWGSGRWHPLSTDAGPPAATPRSLASRQPTRPGSRRPGPRR